MSTSTFAGNTDAPVASVPFGPSEIAVFVTLIASLCNAMVGQDYGLSKNTQAVSAAAAALLPIGLGLFRAIKHKGAMHANAIIYAAQMSQVVTDIATARHAAPPLLPAGSGLVVEPELPQPPAVGLDLPIETVSTTLPSPSDAPATSDL